MSQPGYEESHTSTDGASPDVSAAGANAAVTPAWLCLIPLLALAAYAPGVGCDFVVWDDNIYIRDNPYLRSLTGLIYLWIPHDVVRKFYPITYSTHWFEYQLWGGFATGYFAFNVLLHAACSLLVGVLARVLGIGAIGAVIAGGVFALHPVQVPSVAWLASRKNVLSTALALLAIIAYLRSRRGAGPAGTRFAALLLVAAMLSKAAAVTMVGSIIAAHWLIGGERRWKALLAPLLVPIAVAAVVIHFDSSFESKAMRFGAADLELRPLAAAAAFWAYVGKVVWPVGLIPIDLKWQPMWTAQWIAALAALVVAAGGVIALRQRLGPVLTWCCAHFALTLAPILGLLSFGYLLHAPIGDQYLYLAAVGAAIALGLAADKLAGAARTRQIIVCGVAAGLFIALGALTWQRLPTWSGELAFWSTVVRTNPDFAIGLRRYSIALNVRGRFAESIEVSRRLVAMPGSVASDFSNYAAALMELGRWPESEAATRRAIEMRPIYPAAQMNLAQGLLRYGGLSREEGQLAESLRRDPGNVAAAVGLAYTRLVGGRRSEALADLDRLASANPNHPSVVFARGFAYEVVGNLAIAREGYRAAATLARQAREPDLADEIEIHLATMPP